MEEEDTVPRTLQHPVPEILLSRIGDITVAFALLESTIQSLVWSLVGSGQRVGQIITSEASFQNLRGLAVSLYKERNGEDEEYEELCDLLKRAAGLGAIRNSIWAAGKGADMITRINVTAKQKHGLRFVFDDVSAEKLEEVCTDLKTLASDIQTYWIKLVEGGKASNG